MVPGFGGDPSRTGEGKAMTYKINRSDQTFVAKDMAELKLWAASGKVFLDDLIQAPEAQEWNYAAEVKELQGLVKNRSPLSLRLEDEILAPQGTSAGVRRLVWMISILGMLAILGVAARVFVTPPDPAELKLTGDHAKAVKDREGLLTEVASLRQSPEEQSGAAGELKKDARVVVLSKKGDWYEIESKDGKKGFVKSTQIAPGYLFTEEAHARLDPYFNPDKYLTLTQTDWALASEGQRSVEKKTLLTFGVANSTEYNMDQVVLKIDFIDKDGKQVATRMVEVADVVPAKGEVTVENVEVALDIAEVPNARVRIVGARVTDRKPEPKPEEGEEVQMEGASAG